ncbi:hypothetical protein LJ707_07905 [Mucilaginibacter sp. UR6-1]|uniref:hypothetical protein n=1 Tax=Mucilaginibacter sp. UR6-1 TaxID=1435643 RepID=UPI001E5C4DD0|nr:hypothetical protein [Mucilaginibacter sp. UR6-1]MCC8408850.1 hypothetical protein [Mucilaginibacter sp. UR6-1]
MNTRLQFSADTSVHAKVQDVQHIYDQYAGMLMGYIYDVVKDHKMAEQYLADIFIAVAAIPDVLKTTDENIYCKLQLLARKKLTSYFDTVKECDVNETVKNRPNKFLSSMNTRQLTVFCGIHYHGKNVTAIAAEMNEEEDTVRRLLKEAFLIIRRSNDAGVH